MKFKLLGVEWDFTKIALILWSILGSAVIFWPFIMQDIGWLNLPVAVVAVVWISTAEFVSKYFTDCMGGS